MNDYNELIERCKEICDWQDTGLLKGDALRNFAASRPYAQQHNSVSIAQAETLREVADAFLVMAARVAELEAARIAYASEFPPDDEGLPDTGRIHANICAMKVRVAELKSRLKISPLHNVDGIMARDATIKLQDERIAELEAERAEREKQEPMAWVHMDSRGKLVAHLSEPADDGWMEDGDTCVPLYAAPPVAAPVRLTDEQVERALRTNGAYESDAAYAMAKDGLLTEARAIESAVLRANGFKVEGEQ